VDRENTPDTLEQVPATVAHAESEAQGTDDTKPEGAPASTEKPRTARQVGKTTLAWELIDLTDALEVRHGRLNGDSRVFMKIQPPGRVPAPFVWAGTREARFRNWLSALASKNLGRGPTTSVLEEVISHINGRGFCLESQPIARRVASEEGRILFSLGPASAKAVEITPRGWNLLEDPPALFQHPDNAGTLPEPVRGGSIDLMRRFFPNVQDADWPALVGFMLASFLPEGAFPILALSGSKDSGKSTATELIRAVCDPVFGLDARSTLPETVEDLLTIASTLHMLSFDNLSRIDAAMSDALCTVTTGAAMQKRLLYSQGELHTLRARNPVILNGISLGIDREDLVSRTVFIELQPIPAAIGQKEPRIRAEFQRELPAILGALLDGVALALRDGLDTTISPAHRLEDCACFVSAAEPALGFADGAIVAGWLRSQGARHDDLGSVDPLVEVLSRLLPTAGCWAGSASELLNKALAMGEGEDATPVPKDFPSTAKSLGEQLIRKKDVLKRGGFTISRSRTNAARQLLVTREAIPAPVTDTARIAVSRPVREEPKP
jgi:putative DNA primase/helicase